MTIAKGTQAMIIIATLMSRYRFDMALVRTTHGRYKNSLPSAAVD